MRLVIGTTFYTSFIFKKAPGTTSSIFIYLLLIIFPIQALEYKLLLLLLIGTSHFLCFPFFENKYGDDDPSLYTLDEAFAMVLLNTIFFDLREWTLAFLIFRFFDIVKPLGIKKFEHAKKISASIRNLGDDVIAACYTFLLLTAYQYAF